MNWKSKIKKYALWQMVLPVLLLCLLGVVPASSTFCLLNNTTSALTNTFDTYQAPYLVTYKTNGGYWINTSNNISVQDATELNYGNPIEVYKFALPQEGGTANITFDGTGNNAKPYTLKRDGYELAGWSTMQQDPMTQMEFRSFKNSDYFFATTVDLPAWVNNQTATPTVLYAVWVNSRYTMSNGVSIDNALRGNLSELKTDATDSTKKYYLPASTTSLKDENQPSTTSGRDSTVTHIIFSTGTQTDTNVTLPAATGLKDGYTIANGVTEEQIKAAGYAPIYVDMSQEGYVRLYRVYHDTANAYAISPADTPTSVCVAYFFASDPTTGAVPEKMVGNEDCSYMFYGLTGLLKIGGIGSKVDFSNTKSMANMYAVCTSLLWQDAPIVEGNGQTPRVNIRFGIGRVESLQGMFMGCSSAKIISLVDVNSQFVVGEDGNKYYGTQLGGLKDMSHMFEGCISVTKIRFKNAVLGSEAAAPADNVNTINVTSFANMFLGCRNLDSVDTKYIEIGSGCISLENMFNGCATLTYLPMVESSQVDTSNVQSFKGMFAGCTLIGTAETTDGSAFNLSKFTISDKAKDLSYMFAGCTSLTGITLGDKTHTINTENVTDFSHMFMGCKKLVTFSSTADGVAVFNTQSATTLEGMFMGCTNLTTANVGQWNVSNVKNYNSMFANCLSLTEIDASGWNMGSGVQSGGIDIGGAFMSCSSLKTIYVSSTFKENLGRVTIANSDMAFFGCVALEGNLLDGTTTKYKNLANKIEADTSVNWLRAYGLTADTLGLFTAKAS